MSKINAVRLININYNNNAIRISDECFHFQGDSTLISLRNGGGKSVLVQMITAPFVHKRYRDAKDRPFESYFTTAKPSFILVEWVLDQGAGYVLTGMMVRRSQDTSGEDSEELEMVNIVSEYRGPCLWDIHNLQVVEKKNKEMTLKNFTACRQMFELYKKDRSMEFFCYDMANPAQARQYFDKLQEYQISYKEWEAIIKKVNLKESGLSDLFADCRDEKGLVEKWFLDAVESKLNREKNRMKEFQSILEKYVGQYQDNQSKIRRRDRIRLFREEAGVIREKAEDYRQEEERELQKIHLVARFIRELTRLREEAEEKQKEILGEIHGMEQELLRIEYEKLSAEIYELEKKLHDRISNRDLLETEQEALEREGRKLEHKLHLLACAKQQEILGEEQQELETIKQKIQVSQEKEARLEPERQDLGGRLFGYYREELAKNRQKLSGNERDYGQAGEKANELREKISELEESALKEASREGALKSRVESYGQWEERFFADYGEELIRNILGEYEPGSLEIKKAAYEKELEEQARDRKKKKDLQEKSRREQKNAEKKQGELQVEKARKEIEYRQWEEEKKGFDQELEQRKIVLKYLDMEENSLFDLEKILRVSGRKLKEIDGIRENLRREYDAIYQEYRQLTQGKTQELPKELESELESLGLPVVYGMEWLRKNGNTEEENRRLVRRHPFLPYGLMLSKKELDKLAENAGEVYTSFPVPILVREQMEKGEERAEGGIYRFSDISFYMLFNENLLNEEKLAALIREKEHQLQKKKEAIELRGREYQEYFKRQEQVQNQKVDRERFQEALSRLEGLKEEQEDITEQLKTAREEAEAFKETADRLDQELKESKKQMEFGERRLEDFKRLMEAYGQYRENRMELESCRRRTEKLSEQKAVARANQERLQEKMRSLETEASRLSQEREKLEEKQNIYRKYQDQDNTGGENAGSGGTGKDNTGREKAEALEERKGRDGTYQEEDIRAMEARYAAITGSLSLELKDLEEQESRAQGRCGKAAAELWECQVKFGLTEGEWRDTVYDKKEERHQETLLEGCRRKSGKKRELWVEEQKAIAGLEQQKKDRQARMMETCGREEPLPRKEIQDQDFDARKNRLQYRKDEAARQESALEAKMQSYDQALSGLAEYSDFPLGDDVEWDQDVSGMGVKELRDFKGMLVRDYNQQVESRRQARGILEQQLNRVVRMEEFQEDFYRKPLEAMLDLTGHPEHVLRQISTTLQSYDSLMEKLEVDIALLEKEKQKIAELLEDYVREVHQNLDRIDSNSTITIREKPVKMLKIQLPAWEENENLYRIRIQDMIDEVTAKSLALLKENENAQEYFGAKMTTRNLYDTVIGIGNVQIKLYKIEEQREYPITWAEVARNSGGEGFLSAFVVLSSLLCYMRKDEGDIFADRNEGKVLLMDNPFAQTNASHLLKPLMDMAKKANTQLICLTGLGGESIYNRFDNIYVLNLIAARLQSGVQYLKADHLRGNEPETVAVSHIQVMEQQTLLF